MLLPGSRVKDELTQFLARDFYDNSIQTWLVGLGVAVVLFVVLRLIEEVVVTRIQKLTTRTSTKWDDIFIAALRKTKLWFLAIIAVVAGATFLEVPRAADRVLQRTLIIAFLLQTGVWLSSAFMAWLKSYREEQIEEDAASVMTMNAFGFVVRLALWSTVVLLTLDNLGVDVTALVAGLGVGGIAVALAVQNILGDLFSSLSIVLDKPFVLGDFVIVGDLMGSVENIGIKTTRIRSLSGEQLIFSNTDLLSSRIRNFGRMSERRVVFKLGVVYGTAKQKLEKIPEIVRDAIEAHENTRFDRSHFFEYGDFSLDFESVYYVLDRDYNVYMDVQQAINLRIYERFDDEGIEFAFPTRTVFLEQATRPVADESNGRAPSEDTDRSRQAYL
jgi:small-conductance mechanosensitive channel